MRGEGARLIPDGVAQPRMPWLDLARGLAALQVFLSHLRGSSLVDYAALPDGDKSLLVAGLYLFTRMGHEAVLIFFVLSGYLVGGPVLRRLGDGTFEPLPYAIDRATRILLPLVPAVAITALIGVAMLGTSATSGTVLGNMLGLNGIAVPTIAGNPPLWSIAYEIWFYVLAAAVGCIVSGRGGVALPVLALVASASALVVLNPRYLLFWCLGSLMIFLQGRRPERLLAGLGGLLLVCGAAAYQLGTDSAAGGVRFAILPLAVAETMICIGFALMIPFLARLPSVLGSARLSRFSARTSEFSYSLYLFHYPLLLALSVFIFKSHSLGPVAIAKFALKAALVLGICYLLYRAFEMHTPSLRRWLKRRVARAAGTCTEARHGKAQF